MSVPGSAQPRYTPFDGRSPVVSMGLRALDLTDWLEPDDRRDADLAAKRELLATRHDEVVATLPLGDAGSRETLELVVADLRRRGLLAHGDEYDPALHPIDAAGRLVQEDLCIMARAPGTGEWILAAATVCSPSRWRLADKIGRSVAAIHAPVPGYGRIEAATDRFFDRITVDRPVWRTNWTLLDDPAPFQPDAPPGTHGAAGAPRSVQLPDVWLRVERQTLRLLPHSGAVLFTIRTYVDRLDTLTPRARKDLAATLRDVDADLVAYRGWVRILPTVRAWADTA